MEGKKRTDLKVGQIIYIPVGFDGYKKGQLISCHSEHIHRKNGKWVWLIKLFEDITEEEYTFSVGSETSIEVEDTNYSKIAKKFELEEQIKHLQKELRDLQ